MSHEDQDRPPTMRSSAHDTVVRSISGRPELRQVTQVQEWRVERTLDDDGGVVLSIVAPGGESQSFLVGQADAHDIGEVLRRKAAWVERLEHGDPQRRP